MYSTQGAALSAHSSTRSISLHAKGFDLAKRPHIEMIARALIECDRHILVCTNIRKGYHYLPGGHVEFGESAAAALKREIKEECGLRSTVGDLRAIAEIVFRHKGHIYHELNMVFHVELPGRKAGKCTPVHSLESHIAFNWIPRRTLRSADVRPTAIKDWVVRNRPGDTIAMICDASTRAR